MYVIGADEVGRGCVAGDVFVCAVMASQTGPHLEGVDDSKKVSPRRRERLAAALAAEPDVFHRIARRTAADVDERGIMAVLRECFTEAITGLLDLGKPVATVRIDGNPFTIDVGREVEFLVRGDGSEWTIGAASILAKVARDRYMAGMDAVHPGYGFADHAGYGTAAHIEAIRSRGLSPIHRATFCKAWVPREEASLFDLFSEVGRSSEG